MWNHILAVAWAQFRISRNHLPRTSFGTVISWLFLLLWYGIFGGLAAGLVLKVPDVSMALLMKWLPSGLLGVFLFWQVVPLFTLSSGWSLQLNKLQIYPVRANALFALETVLRITSAPEMIIVLTGATIGLMRRPDVPLLAPLILFLFIPLNLFLQLAIRDLVLHSFERNRFRELFAVVVISVAILPQLILRTGLGAALKPYYFVAAGSHFAPWSEAASLALGRFQWLDAVLLVCWTAAALVFARRMFARSMVADDNFQSAGVPLVKQPIERRARISEWPARVFKDPLAALLQKELQSLLRMPRFRVMFGMSCILGLVVFGSSALNSGDSNYRNSADPVAHFMRNNLIPVVNMYGLLLLSDSLLLNAFGLDRGAVQTYFVTPVSLATVLKAKNLTAIVFVVLQSAVILLVATFSHAPITPMSVISGLLASAVVTVFLLAVGNLTSLTMPRPIDPKQTFKKQAGAKMQIWLLGCSLALFILVGFGFLARYALQSDWVLLGVLTFEFVCGLVVYRLGLESAVARGLRNREKIVGLLSKNASPVSLG